MRVTPSPPPRSVFAPSCACVVLSLLACTPSGGEPAPLSPPVPSPSAPIEATVAAPAAAPPSAPLTVSAPPMDVVARFHLSPFYRQYLDVESLPIVGSARVSPFAVKEARFLVLQMIGHRPEILRAMANNDVRLAVMAATEMTTDIPEHSDMTPKAYWNRRARGLGATVQRPAVSVAEENLLDFPGDPYSTENILTHELAHAIHERGMVTVDPTFDARLTTAYPREGALGEYVRGNEPHGILGGGDAVVVRLQPRERQPARADRHAREARPVRSGDRRAPPRGLRRSSLALQEAVAATRRGARAPRWLRRHDRAALHVACLRTAARQRRVAGGARVASSERRAASPHSTTPTSIRFENHRSADVTIAWLTFEGARKTYATLRPGATVMQETYVGHLWVVSEAGKILGAASATFAPGVLEIR